MEDIKRLMRIAYLKGKMDGQTEAALGPVEAKLLFTDEMTAYVIDGLYDCNQGEG